MDRGFSITDGLSIEARRVWEKVAGTDPTSPAILNLSRIYLNQSEPGSALTLAERVLAAHPGLLPAAILTAQALLALGRSDRARDVLKESLAHLDELAEHLREFSGLLSQVGQKEAAGRTGKAAEALLPYAVSTGTRPAFSPVSDQQPVKEDMYTEETVEAIPTETLAALYLSQGHKDKALAIYEKLVSLQPQDVRLKSKLAGLRDEAILDAWSPETIAARSLVIETKSDQDQAKKKLMDRLERLKEAARRRRSMTEATLPQ